MLTYALLQNKTTAVSSAVRNARATQGNVCYTFRNHPVATARQVTNTAVATPVSTQPAMPWRVREPLVPAAQPETVTTSSSSKETKQDDAVFLTPLPLITYTKPPTRITKQSAKPKPSNPCQNQLIKALLAQKSTPGPYMARPHAPRGTTSFIIRASTQSPSGKTQILNLPVNVSTPVSIVRNVTQGTVRPTITHNLLVKEVGKRPASRSAFVRTSAGIDFTARNPALATVAPTQASTTMPVTTPMTMISPVPYSISPIIAATGTGAVVTTTVSTALPKPFIFTSTASPRTGTKSFPTYTKAYIPVPHVRAPNRDLNEAKLAAPTSFTMKKTHNLIGARFLPVASNTRLAIPPGVTMLGPGGVVTTSALTPTIIKRSHARSNVIKSNYLEPGEIPQVRKAPPRTFPGPRSVSAAQRQTAEHDHQQASTAQLKAARHAEHHAESQAQLRALQAHGASRAILHATSLAALQAASHAQLEAAAQARLKAQQAKNKAATQKQSSTTSQTQLQITSLGQLQTVTLARPQGTLNVQLLTASQAQLLANSKLQLISTSQAQHQATSQTQLQATSQEQLQSTSQVQPLTTSQAQLQGLQAQLLNSSQAQFQELSEAQFQAVSQAQLLTTSQTQHEDTSQVLQAQFHEISQAQFQTISQAHYQAVSQAQLEATSQAQYTSQEVSKQQHIANSQTQNAVSQAQLQLTQTQFQIVSQSQLQAVSQAQLLTTPQAQLHSVSFPHHQVGYVQPSLRTHHRLIIRSAPSSASGDERIITTPAILQGIADSAAADAKSQSEQLSSTSLQGSVDIASSSIHNTTTLTLPTGTTVILPHYKTTVFKNLSNIANNEHTRVTASTAAAATTINNTNSTANPAAAAAERVVIRRPVAYFSARRTFPTQSSGTPVNVQRHIIRTIPRHLLGTHFQSPTAQALAQSVPQIPQMVSTSSPELSDFIKLSQNMPQSADKNL